MPEKHGCKSLKEKYIFYLIITRSIAFLAENCKKIMSSHLQTYFKVAFVKNSQIQASAFELTLHPHIMHGGVPVQ